MRPAKPSIPGTLAVVALFWTFSIALTTYNAAVLQTSGLQYPLFMTAAQMLFFALATNAAAAALPRAWPRWEAAEAKDVPRAWAVMAPLGVTKGADIGLSNVALRFLPVATYTLIKSVAPAFVRRSTGTGCACWPLLTEFGSDLYHSPLFFPLRPCSFPQFPGCV